MSTTGAELLFERISQRYRRGPTLITSNLPFDEWTETFGSERLTGALPDRLTQHVSILEMNGESYRLANSTARQQHCPQAALIRIQTFTTTGPDGPVRHPRASYVASARAMAHILTK